MDKTCPPQGLFAQQSFQQISVENEVEHKGNPENSLPRNSLAFKAQILSLAWLTHLAHLATSASLPSAL